MQSPVLPTEWFMPIALSDEDSELIRHRFRVRACLALLAVPVLAACSRSSPEQQLRDTIAKMSDAVEARDASTLLAHVADDFTRDSGGMDRQQLRSLMLGLFLRNQRIKVLSTISDLRVDGERATVKLAVLATGGAGLLPERGRAWNVTTTWRREKSEWKVFNAQWAD